MNRVEELSAANRRGACGRSVRWPALAVVALAATCVARAGDVVINEIHYEPLDKTAREEFIELYNSGAAAVDLSRWSFSDGVEYTFPPGTALSPAAYLVVAQDPRALAASLGAPAALGPYAGKLDNEGERIVLRNAAGAIEDEVDYGVGFPWPLASAGEGASMELIDAALDNDLGGSWRASGLVDRPQEPRAFFLEAEDREWHYRKGTSEPPSTWRDFDFVEDESWLVGQTSIGFEDDDDNTVLEDMRRNYSSLYLRHAFTVPRNAPLPKFVKLGLYVDDGAIVWINGVEVARLRVAADAEPAHDGRASRGSEAEWEEMFLANPANYLVPGENILAIHALNATVNSNDFSIDARLFVPGSDDFEGFIAPPTPGLENTVVAPNAPPQIRQVNHATREPRENTPNVITLKVTDPDGVATVRLDYQIVLPGHYIPAFLPLAHATLIARPGEPRPKNPDFEAPASWTSVLMVDDGTGADAVAHDDTYTAVIPGQANRTLVRYRVSATDLRGASVRGPYDDDPSLNFAYFVYNGVPDYAVETSVLGGPTVHPATALTSVPVYILMTRNEDITACIAATSNLQITQGLEARFAFNWEGAFVYEGIVYDHIRYRLRGANGRYQTPPGNPGSSAGKRHWRFKFNKPHFFRARDKWGNRFPTEWRVLNTGRMFGNRLDGNWGLGDQVNDILWRAYGVPSAHGFAFHWRVIDGEEEAPSGAGGQYHGDFWGLARAFENYDRKFLEAHDLPKGNLYKLVNQTTNGLQQQRYQAPDAVTDGSDHDNIEQRLRPAQNDAWLTAHVDYEKWYRYHSIAQAIRHYDYWPEANKNAAWYFYPEYTEENGFLGRMWTLPFDADATWGPTWNQGQDRPWAAIFSTGRREFQKAYRNHVREVLDLLWQRDQLEQIIRQTAAFMDPLEEADIDRWRGGPAAAGRQYFPNPREGTLEGKAADMLRFAFTGGSWPGGSVGAGGRAAFLDDLADRTERNQLPGTPRVTYTGPPGHPIDALTFRTDEFSDPQGSTTFGAIEWRLAEVTPIPDAGSIPLDDPIWKARPVALELQATWRSGALTTFAADVEIPVSVVHPARTYRVRVRMRDDTGLWSHWSPPVEFTTSGASGVVAELEDLRITEIMYNPIGGSEFEFIELENKGAQTLDLNAVRFEDGIDFVFSTSEIKRLAPGEIVVLVRDLASFSRRYDVAGLRVAGEYSGKLDNAGERLRLAFGQLDVLDFTYEDEWYPTTDGEGRSLNIVDVRGPRESWNDASSWFPSSVLHGTPGSRDTGGTESGFLRPGDTNLDGSVNIADAVSLLVLLFHGERAAPPCGGGDGLGGNVPFLYFDGSGDLALNDAVLLLEHLFRRGPPHVLGVRCAPFDGCPSACGG